MQRHKTENMSKNSSNNIALSVVLIYMFRSVILCPNAQTYGGVDLRYQAVKPARAAVKFVPNSGQIYPPS